ncbi:hypothetical protein N9R81_05825, partial [Flavobacteriales bacterium]|nr:hypothetical protein [Flavobacteriales bacterium]
HFIGTTDAQDLAIYTNNVEKMRVTSGGEVGIGTDTPRGFMDIRGLNNGVGTGDDVTVFIGQTASNGDAMIELNRGGGNAAAGSDIFLSGKGVVATSNNMYLNIDSDNDGTGNLFFGKATEASNSTKLMTIRNSGNTGIGTTTPQNRLDIEGGAVIGATYSGTNTAPTNGLLVEGNVGIGTNNPQANLDVTGVSGTNGEIRLNSGGATPVFSIRDNAATPQEWVFHMNNAPNSFLAPLLNTNRLFLSTRATTFTRNGTHTNVMTFDPSGKIGIGTNSPTNRMHIVGIERIDRSLGANPPANYDANRFISIFNTDKPGDSRILDITTDANNTAIIRSVATDMALFGGFIGIGTATPRSTLDVGGNMALAFILATANDATPAINGGNILVINNTAATTITDLDNPVAGQIIRIIVNGGTPPTINDAGNFNLSGNWTPGVNDVLELFVRADNDYVEISRTNN